MLKVTHRKSKCTGCMLCAEVAPHYWAMGKDGLSQLIHPDETRKGVVVGEGFEEDRTVLEKAESGCPVKIIKIEDY